MGQLHQSHHLGSLFAESPFARIGLICTVGRAERTIATGAGPDVAGLWRGLCTDKWVRPRLRQRFAHEIPPYMSRKIAARDALHRRIIIIADPYASNEWACETNEPSIAITLTRAGLAGCERARIGIAPRAPLDDQLE